MDIFAAAQAITTTKSLDTGFVALVLTLGALLLGALIFAVNKHSKFNGENLGDKKATSDHLNRQIYQNGTAPLVQAVSTFLYEQLITNFNKTEQEVISRYEDRRQTLIDPNDTAFIDMSNLPESLEHDRLIAELVSAYSTTVEHDSCFESAKKNLNRFKKACWIPLIILGASLMLHIMSHLVFRNTARWELITNIAFVISILTVPIEAFFYFRYMKCVKKLDDYLDRGSDD